METIKDSLLASPFWVIAGLVLAQIVLTAIWYEKRTSRRLWLLAIPPVTAGLLLILWAGVRTDRDRILSEAGAIAADIAQDRSEALEKFLDERFTGYYEGASLTKAGAIAKCRQEKNRYRVREIRISEPQLQITGRRAEMIAPTYMTVDTELGLFKAKVTFKLTWIKTDAGWVLWQAQEPEIQRF